jgi:Ca-activated chloride channel family protein
MIAPMPVPAPEVVTVPEADTEAFANADTNPVKVTRDDPVSTFSIDVDTASYAVVRSSLTAGHLPPRDAVRVEEMVNYFPYAYPAPDGEHPFATTVTVTETPWNPDTNLLHIGIQGTLPDVEDRPPLNLVFLIDTSGSMQNADKLPLLIQSLRLMLTELRPEDEVAIVTYAGSAGQVLEATPASDRRTILNALDRLQAGGSTAGQAGLQQAYAVAEDMAEDGEVTRVILATDGDFNVGLSDPEALKDFIADKRETGTYLSVLGFGRGNLDDATMQALAQNGNGQAAYIDTLSEARKVLVDQLTGALFPIAGDVKIQIEFNPGQVAEYRLIGYETRALAREDFNNDRVDAGDIGAGHSVTAIYEVTPVGSPAVLSTPLRYSAEEVAAVSDELAFLRLRYKRPGESTSQLIETPVLPGAGEAGDDVRFSTAIAGFGQLLRGAEHTGDWSYADAIDLANGARA